MVKELAEYIDVCDSKEIQDWSENQTPSHCILDAKGKWSRNVYLPTIDQLIEMLGERLEKICTAKIGWMVVLLQMKDYFVGQSIRIALARACKEVLSGK